MLARYNSHHTGLEKVKGALFCTLALTMMGVFALLINVIQILSIPCLLFSKKFSRKIHRTLAFSWWGSAVLLMEKYKRVELVFTGEKVPLKENVVVIANHQSMADVAPLLALAYRKKRLPHLKWFAKDILKYVPGMGWGIYLAGNFFVKRDWLRDQEKIDKVFERVLRDREPMWLISFLEGTRITAEKLKKSQTFSKERGRPVLEHLLAPRTKGFEAVIRSLRAHLDAVYDVTIAFPQGTPTLITLFSGYIHRIDIHVRRFPIQSLPFSEQELAEWVWRVFAEKDELLKHFVKYGFFPEPRLSELL
jgi:1-acyl-sn-glycerol-3-phosphate acyltransferase